LLQDKRYKLNLLRSTMILIPSLVRNKLLFLTGILFFAIFSVSSAENIRIAIADNQKTITLTSSNGFKADREHPEIRQKKITFSSNSLEHAETRLSSLDGFVKINGKNYRGWIEVRKKKNGRFLVVNELDIEEYLKGVISAEVPSHWQFEALKAQAVASRSYALYQKRESGNRPYHMLASEMSQVYNGSSPERKNAVRAVQETNGLVLMYRGQIIPAFYHSSCGGHTENAAELWGIDEPYLRGVDCECQRISPYGLWEKRVEMSKLLTALKRLGYRLQSITGLNIGDITPAGRVKTIAVRSANHSFLVPGESLRGALGNTVIPSVFFELEITGYEIIFSGRGRGHGVGLCQWGAQEMALQDQDFRSILSHYYPGTVLVRLKE